MQRGAPTTRADWERSYALAETALHEAGINNVADLLKLEEVRVRFLGRKGEITELAGCDLLTISPTLLAELAASTEPLAKKLDASAAQALDLKQVHLDEKTFRYELNEDAMATEKTAQGIRSFAADIVKLEQLISAKL